MENGYDYRLTFYVTGLFGVEIIPVDVKIANKISNQEYLDTLVEELQGKVEALKVYGKHSKCLGFSRYETKED